MNLKDSKSYPEMGFLSAKLVKWEYKNRELEMKMIIRNMDENGTDSNFFLFILSTMGREKPWERINETGRMNRNLILEGYM